jgi:5-methylcytosine-specific restriction endonuclease McrA
MDSTLKVCTKCGEAKPATPEFFHRRGPGKLRNECITCWRKKCAAYQLEHRDGANARNRAYITRNPDRRKASTAAYKRRNPETVRADARLYAKRHPELVRQRKAASRAANPEKARQAFRSWAARNPERILANLARRRARQMGASGSFTAEDVRRQHERQAGRCWWCGEPLNGRFHRDHLIPLSRGGSNEASNLVLAHPFCNISKKDKMPLEFAGRLF